jgi:hypothetical protein
MAGEFSVILATDPEGLGMALDPDGAELIPAALLKFVCTDGGSKNHPSYSCSLCGLEAGRKGDGMRTVRRTSGGLNKPSLLISCAPPCVMQDMWSPRNQGNSNTGSTDEPKLIYWRFIRVGYCTALASVLFRSHNPNIATEVLLWQF